MAHNKQELEKLKKEWYERLKSEGFEDAEQMDGRLKSWHSHYFKVRHPTEKMEAATKYYDMASSFVHTHQFDSELEKSIWTAHSEGLSVRKIVKLLNDPKAHRRRVDETIRKLKKLMAESWTQNE